MPLVSLFLPLLTGEGGNGGRSLLWSAVSDGSGGVGALGGGGVLGSGGRDASSEWKADLGSSVLVLLDLVRSAPYLLAAFLVLSLCSFSTFLMVAE